MADITLYLNPDLGTGNNDGSSVPNAFQSWSICIAYLNTNHADMVTATESVDIIVSGGIEDFVNIQLSCAVICSETYPLRFDASAVATPGIWDTTKPTLSWSPTSDAVTEFFPFTAIGDMWVEFINVGIIWNTTYTGSSISRFFVNTGTKTSVTSKLVFTDCYIKGGNNTSAGEMTFYYSQAGGMTVKAENTIVENFTTSSGLFYPFWNTRFSSEGISTFVNCSLINLDDFDNDAFARSNCLMINCLFSNVTDPSCDEHADCGYNASDSATALPGINNTNSASFTFISSTDRHLTNSNAWGAGTGVATYGPYVPSLDIDGDIRGAVTVSTGVDEPVSSQNTPISTIIKTQLMNGGL